MPRTSQKSWLLGVGLVVLIGLCVGGPLLLTGSGITLWMAVRDPATARPTAAPPPTLRPLAQVQPSLTPAPTETATLIPLADPSTPTPAPTATASPTQPSPTDTPLPTDTPMPPTETVPPTQPAPPTAVPEQPTDTPVPSFAFSVVEHEIFPTGNPGFDAFVAITDADNKPLSGYRVVGNHSSGLQVEGPLSAGDWTENSGAMHYKAGNIKYQVPNSPTGVWTLQLFNSAGQPVAAPLEIPFDDTDPTWHFVIFQKMN